MKLKIICFFLVPFFLFCVVLPLPASAVAGVVTAGEALQAAEILDTLVDLGLVDLNQPGTYFTPSLFLRFASGCFDATAYDVGEVSPFLEKLFDTNNKLFWSNDKSTVLQEHNGEYVPVNGAGDLWFTTGDMNSGTRIPFNYIAQHSGFGSYTYSVDKKSYVMTPVFREKQGAFGSSFYALPIIASGSDMGYMNHITFFDCTPSDDNYLNIYNFDLSNLDTPTKTTDLPIDYTGQYENAFGDNLIFGYSVSADRCLTIRHSNPDCLDSNGAIMTANTAVASFIDNTNWLDSLTGNLLSFTSGDISYLYYTSKPISIPSDLPSGNYIYNNTPDNPSNTVVISPSGEFANFLDFIQNGFKFTGKVEATIDNSITFDGHLSADITADINANHTGDVNINITYPDQQFWADDGSATDFGNGVTLDGNSFNDGFKWLIDSVKAVPAVLASFTFIPAPVIAIISAALVCMVFLGFWRTFKGGS